MGETGKAGHTPGPWRVLGEVRPVEPCYRLYCGEVRPKPGSYRGPVCTIQSAAHLKNGISNQEAEANAHLIAAAPEMLTALKMVREFGLADEDGAGQLEDIVEAAIAAATPSS